jgi:glycosyltransferase involved in cell wall biosynthesis
MDKKLTISVVMIARNESEHIARALESAKEADEIIVCDTGSTDNGETVAIAKRYTDKVYEDYKWEDSFCKARNHAKSKATCEWIFSLDCDEYIHDFSKVREAVEEAESKGIRAIDITQIAESDGQTNVFPRLFRNDPDIVWHGNAHNYISVIGTKIGDVKLTFGYSLAHLADPDRTLRILEGTVQKDEGGARELYYLGREYYYRQRWQDTTATLGKYVQMTRFLPEKADAFLMMAHCYWQQSLGDDARDACAQAIIINPDFKEALLFMAELSWPRQAARWRSFAELADNTDVLFVRNVQ